MAPRTYGLVILVDIAKGSLVDVIPRSKSMIHDISLTGIFGVLPQVAECKLLACISFH